MEFLSKLVFLITLSCIFLTGCVLDYDDNRLAEFEVISSGYQSDIKNSRSIEIQTDEQYLEVINMLPSASVPLPYVDFQHNEVVMVLSPLQATRCSKLSVESVEDSSYSRIINITEQELDADYCNENYGGPDNNLYVAVKFDSVSRPISINYKYVKSF